MKFTFIKKAFVTLLLGSLVVMTINYFLIPRRFENYFSTSSTERIYFPKSAEIAHNKSDFKSSAKYPNKVTEKAPFVSKCGYEVHV